MKLREFQKYIDEKKELERLLNVNDQELIG
jgi:hypothetical protein